MNNFRLHVTITIALVIVFAALAVPKAQASMTRGIYVNGQVHYFTVGSASNQQTISHQAGTVDTTTFALMPGPAVTQNVNSCTPDYVNESAMNGAVFNNMIYFAYTGNPGCKNPPAAGGTHVYVTVYDPGSNTFPNAPVDLGAVAGTDANMYSTISSASAAIVVFNNMLYVFADNAVYTSADGVNWSPHMQALPVQSGKVMEPMDAITFCPPNGNPTIMLVFGTYVEYPQCFNGYDNLYTATWNGQFGTASVFNGSTIAPTGSASNAVYFEKASLFTGTAAPYLNVPGLPSGATTPSLQLFVVGTNMNPSNGGSYKPAVRRFEYSYTSTSANWTQDPDVLIPSNSTAQGAWGILVFPWFENQCVTSPPNNIPIQRQYFVINAPTSSSTTQYYAYLSDAMVPLNSDTPLSCTSGADPGTWSWGGTNNVTSDVSSTLSTFQEYWTLMGVVIGSPPFSINGATDETDIYALSTVQYGQDNSTEENTSQTTSNGVMASAGLKVWGGLPHSLTIKDQIDASYKHAWESEHSNSTTCTLSYGHTFGTVNESADQAGRFGWGIFQQPVITIQDYALYAYDFNTSTNSGTPLDLDLTTTQVFSSSVSAVAFELANPGGPNDDIPGLMTGIGIQTGTGIVPYNQSTDLAGWTQGYESSSTQSATTHYKTVLGDGSEGEPVINTLSFTVGETSEVEYTKTTQNVSSTGQTSDVDVSNTTTLAGGTELLGFKASLTAGYSGTFSNSQTNTTTMDSNVKATLDMISCPSSSTDPTCIKTLTVQPYLLQATDSSAPWVPASYQGQLPWAMQWKVVSYTTAAGGQSGVSPLPDRASGAVVGNPGGLLTGRGAGAGSYSIKSGKMAWQNGDGTLSPTPMTAEQFDPALGVSFKLNGYTWSSLQASGKWSRSQDTWTFRTGKRVKKDVVVLKLDFETKTWDLDLSKTDLSPFLGVSDSRAHVNLNVNGKHGFYFDCKHDIQTQWNHNPSLTADGSGLSLTRFNGSFDSSTGKGVVTMEGDLPANLQYFGDMSFAANGSQFNVSLISNANFKKAFAKGSKLAVNKNGHQLSLDFGKKKWRIHSTGKIDPKFVPRSSGTTIEVKVGGETWYSGSHKAPDFISKLHYVNPNSM